MSPSTDRTNYGYVHLQGWNGVTRQRVQIVGKTPKRFRIRAIEPTKLAGRSRWILSGEEALVPQYAVTLEDQ
jgi:hypothetical protein